jgi:hypothetical protein
MWHIRIHGLAKEFPLGSPLAVLVDEAANWAAFPGLAHLFRLILPAWMKRPRSGLAPARPPAQ